MAIVLSSPQTQTFIHNFMLASCCYLQPTTRISFSLKTPSTSLTVKCQQTNHSSSLQPKTQDEGIPIEDVKILVKFKSRHNYIRVLEVSRTADHPFRGSRLLLLDGPGNIHSISFLFKTLTKTYFDVFATLPPILPPGPLAILGFGAGSTARILLELYPDAVVHGWELDPSVIEVAREFFNLGKLERENKDRLFIYIGNALNASLKDGFSGIMVDLFTKGSLIPELQDPSTWEKIKKCLRKGGRVMVNVGGSCVEPENKFRDGKVVMEETLKAMKVVFGKKLFVLSLGNRKDDSSLALTGDLPQLDAWKKALNKGSLRYYVDMWTRYSVSGEVDGCNITSNIPSCGTGSPYTCSYGPRKTLAIAFDMRSEGSRKINAGREGGFGLASLDSDNKGEELEGFSYRTRSLRSRRIPPPPPAPMENRHKVTAKAFIAAAPSIRSPPH